MPTLDEILNESLGEQTITKTASNNNELEKLAEEIGLINETDGLSEKPLIKEATMLHDLYNDLFPGNEGDLTGQEKTAMEKTSAEIEEAMGRYAYGVYADVFQGEIEKMAAELVQAHVTDEVHPQSLANNEDTSENAIDTDGNEGAEGVAAMGLNPKGTVGQFEHRSSPNGEAVKQAALQKHLLMAELGLN